MREGGRKWEGEGRGREDMGGEQRTGREGFIFRGKKPPSNANLTNF